MATLRVIRAAGGLITRHNADDELHVLLIHRPRRKDWTFPKGKLEDGESAEACALREIREETGLTCRLGRELPSTSYVTRKGRRKIVRYGIMEVVAGRARPRHEVDEVRWVTLMGAPALLTYERELAEFKGALDRDRSLASR